MEDNYIMFQDENGKETPYEMWDAIEYNEEQYAVLLPAEEKDDEAEVEVTILKLIELDDEQYDFEDVEDEATQDAVFAIFMDRMDKMEDDEE